MNVNRATILRRGVRSMVEILIGTIIGVCLVLYPILYYFQSSMIFFPQAVDRGALEWYATPGHRVEDVEIPGADGVHLRGWLARAEESGPRPLLIYFGGNAEEVSGHLTDCAHLRGWSLLLVNYRGYGDSEGRPGEAALLADALLIHDHLTADPAIDHARVIAMGRSLGTGVAVHLAAHRPLAGVVLISPYDSMVEVARTHYPYVPVSLMLRHRFEAIALAPAIRAPMLALIADRDVIVPPVRSRRLVAAWGGPAREVVLPGADHNTISNEAGFWPEVTAFLATMAPR